MPVMTLDEFIAEEVRTSGKTLYTLADVCELTERWIQFKAAAAPAFAGWHEPTGDEAAKVDRLLFGERK